MPTSALGWPDPYLPNNDPTASTPLPTWSKPLVVFAGFVLAQVFVTDRAFADSYLTVVKKYYANKTDPVLSDCTADYARIILPRLNNVVHPATFNEHDFANLHHAIWLYLLESFTCLVDKNPHGDWGEPPLGGVGRGDGGPVDATGRFRCFHNIPNGKGYYGLRSGDMPNAAPVTP